MTIDNEAVLKTTFDSEKTITFPHGIPGFEKYTTYLVYHKEESDVSGYWLESCDKPGVTFAMVDPGQYGLSYEMQLSDEEKKLLQAETAEELGVFLILSKKEGGGTATPVLNANIAGPVVINPRARLGLQKVIYHPNLKTTIVGDTQE